MLEFVKKNFLEPETNYGGSLRDIWKLEKAWINKQKTYPYTEKNITKANLIAEPMVCRMEQTKNTLVMLRIRMPFYWSLFKWK